MPAHTVVAAVATLRPRGHSRSDAAGLCADRMHDSCYCSVVANSNQSRSRRSRYANLLYLLPGAWYTARPGIRVRLVDGALGAYEGPMAYLTHIYNQRRGVTNNKGAVEYSQPCRVPPRPRSYARNTPRPASSEPHKQGCAAHSICLPHALISVHNLHTVDQTCTDALSSSGSDAVRGIGPAVTRTSVSQICTRTRCFAAVRLERVQRRTSHLFLTARFPSCRFQELDPKGS